MPIRLLLLLGLLLAAGEARGQPGELPAAPDAGRAAEADRAQFGDRRLIRPEGDALGEPSSDDEPLPALPGPATRAPVATDPAPADWGNVHSPRQTPTQPPAIEYLLVRPPQKVAQQEWGNGFEQSVFEPSETYHRGPLLYPAVELDRPDGLAPIGVFGDHTLEAGGKIFVSYRYNYANFDGNRDGTGDLSTDDVLNDFPIAPTRMQTQRHTALIEYGVTDDLTILGLLPFWDLSIDQVTRGGTGITNANTDPGDIIFEALYVVWRGDRQQVHLNLGMQFPLGVDGTDRFPPTATSPDKSYPLRTTSGTYDFMPGATYRGQNDDWTWGAQGTGMIRFGLNSDDYKLGNRLNLTAWLSRRLSDHLSLSGRLDGNIWGNVFGADPRLNQQLVPTNRPHLQGGRRLDLLFGLNLYLPGDYLEAQWFSVEGGIPVYQSLFGPQLKADWMITAGYNLRF